MANTGRTVSKYTRVYIGDTTHVSALSCYTNNIGQSGVEFDMAEDAPFCKEVKGYLPDQGSIIAGPINVTLDSSTAADNPHNVLVALQGLPVYLVETIGIREEPTTGSPAFVKVGTLKRYDFAPAGGMVFGTAEISAGCATAAVANLAAYTQPFGVVLHGMAAATAANSSTSDIVNNGAATTAGGYVVYVVTDITPGTGSIDLIVDSSADNDTWGTFTEATYAGITTAGIYIRALPPTTTVKQYLRWSLSLNGDASTITFATIFVRG